MQELAPGIFHWTAFHERIRMEVCSYYVEPAGRRELAPGFSHWPAFHERIGMEVCSYYVEPAGVVIAPMLPAEGLDWFDGHEKPQQALLSPRPHYRHCDEFVDRFGLTVVAS